MITQKHIRHKITAAQRLTEAEGLWLYEQAHLPYLQEMANIVRHRANGYNVCFNKNIHIEPTNICVNGCLFCAFAKQAHTDSGAFALSIEEIRLIAQKYQNADLTEIHITGGVHPQWGLGYYTEILAAVRSTLPNVHIKAFTAEEIWKMHSASGFDVVEVLRHLIAAGLGSLAGGGAEILNDNVRAKICPQKINSATWLSVHQTAHHTGIKSNATMLYGHVETYAHRIEHLAQLRTLQDQTHGFNAFIPLKYRKLNSAMPVQAEVGLQEDCRNMAVCRIFLDNIPHLKAYLPALGKDAIATMLQCGADDLDGTMYDGTKIYASSGNAAAPAITIDELQQVCTQAGYRLRERNSEYVLSEFLFELDGCVAKS